MSTVRWPLIVLVGLVATTPARAGGWFSNRDDCAPGTRPRQAKPQYQQEFLQAKPLGDMSCCALASYGESLRYQINQQALSQYMRPIVGTAPAPAPAAAGATDAKPTPTTPPDAKPVTPAAPATPPTPPDAKPVAPAAGALPEVPR